MSCLRRMLWGPTLLERPRGLVLKVRGFRFVGSVIGSVLSSLRHLIFVCWSVGLWFIHDIFLKEREVSLQCSYWSTCFHTDMNTKQNVDIKSAYLNLSGVPFWNLETCSAIDLNLWWIIYFQYHILFIFICLTYTSRFATTPEGTIKIGVLFND